MTTIIGYDMYVSAWLVMNPKRLDQSIIKIIFYMVCTVRVLHNTMYNIYFVYILFECYFVKKLDHNH